MSTETKQAITVGWHILAQTESDDELVYRVFPFREEQIHPDAKMVGVLHAYEDRDVRVCLEWARSHPPQVHRLNEPEKYEVTVDPEVHW